MSHLNRGILLDEVLHTLFLVAIGNDCESLSNLEGRVQVTVTILTHRKRVQGCEQRNGCRSTDALPIVMGTFIS